jgi:2-polyprenyl-3-methyl-5-hydroxy-6-metoxy-1,4-benzoquinol methylase
MFEHLVGKITSFKRNGILLDVGAGVGTLMHVAKKHGFETYGVEISEWASAYARDKRGLNMITGALENAAYPDAHFDVIVINHVLEHVADPIKLLSKVRRILKDDGVLVVGVPNIGSIMARIMRERWLSLRPEEHIWHFSANTLRRLIDKAEFHEIYFEARDNYSVQGWRPKKIAQRIINRVSVIMNRSEAMLLIASKK